MHLRDYQQNSIDILTNNIKNGIYNNIVALPTGLGKTVISLSICKKAALKDNNCLFLCDRREIINQTIKLFNSHNLNEHVVIMTNQSLTSMCKEKIETNELHTHKLVNYNKLEMFIKNFKVIIIDEVHTRYSINDKIAEIAFANKIVIIGLSATPYNKYLKPIFNNNLIIPLSTNDAFKNNYLVKPEFITLNKKLDLKLERTAIKKGEYDYVELERVLLDINNIVISLTDKFIKENNLKNILMFGTTINHCKTLSKSLNQIGFKADLYNSHMNDNQKKEVVNKFKNNELDILISVDALAKGFDYPAIDGIVDCRPIYKSISTIIQMIGRGTRISPNKDKFLYLDLSGNYIKFKNEIEIIYSGNINTLDKCNLLLDVNVNKKTKYSCNHCLKELPLRLKPDQHCLYKDCEKKQGYKCVGCGTINETKKCGNCILGNDDKKKNHFKSVINNYIKTRCNSQLDIFRQICYVVNSIKGFDIDKKNWYAHLVYKRMFNDDIDEHIGTIQHMIPSRFVLKIITLVRNEIRKEYENKKRIRETTTRSDNKVS